MNHRPTTLRECASVVFQIMGGESNRNIYGVASGGISRTQGSSEARNLRWMLEWGVGVRATRLTSKG